MAIEKRSRYYHSQMDMELLLSGDEYGKLPNSYVIFICDFDPFGEKKYCYTFENICVEDIKLRLKDGCKSIFLSTKGENDKEVPKQLVSFLKFVKADLEESTGDFQDEFVEKLQNTIKHVKESREMEKRFMLFQELLRDERAEGRTEGRIDALLLILEEKGSVSKDLYDKIVNEKDIEVLNRWIKMATKVTSIDQFLEKM